MAVLLLFHFSFFFLTSLFIIDHTRYWAKVLGTCDLWRPTVSVFFFLKLEKNVFRPTAAISLNNSLFKFFFKNNCYVHLVCVCVLRSDLMRWGRGWWGGDFSLLPLEPIRIIIKKKPASLVVPAFPHLGIRTSSYIQIPHQDHVTVGISLEVTWSISRPMTAAPGSSYFWFIIFLACRVFFFHTDTAVPV